MRCHVCQGSSHRFAEATVLQMHAIEYFQCSQCRFVQTETPHWLDQAYDNAIISTDVGLIARNEKFAKATSRLLNLVLRRSTQCIDYGGGYGMMTRMLRDRGHAFSHYDPHCENLFAAELEWQDTDGRNDLLTAFEVWEHLANPLGDIAEMDNLADNWLFSTLLLPDDDPKPGEWWYYALDGGQHVSLWTESALQVVAEKFSRHYINLGHGLHLMTQQKLNRRLVRWAMFSRSSSLLNQAFKKKSLTQVDYAAALERASGGGTTSSQAIRLTDVA